MKLDDLDRAKKMGEELKELERKYGYFQNVHAIEVSGRDGSYRIELGDYPEPSELGRAFVAVQKAVEHYYFDQITLKRAELTKLGIQL